ncbi:MAG: YjjG family noncanonical pyrimidine nucleotidase [Bacteroidales bacterium]|nr:YjjG family noncanonical pyrimidine nucleotidase [Bacteroidales bacterium]
MRSFAVSEAVKTYRHIFFDLDRTLWDFEQNCAETLHQVITEFSIDKIKDQEKEFIRAYNYFNDHLWDHYRRGKIKKSLLKHERFRLLFNHFGINNKELVQKVSRFYLNNCPLKSALMPNAKEIIRYLYDNYTLCVISNGFYDAQLTKMKNSGISPYFKKLFTSDRIGYAKPHKGIYEYSVSAVHATKEASIMIGDDPRNDIDGAKNAGIDQVYYKQKKDENEINATFIIESLLELKDIL